MSDHRGGTPVGRRAFLGAAAGAGAIAMTGLAAGRAQAAVGRAGAAADQPVPLTIAGASQWETNQVALTDWGQMFVGGPRFLSPGQLTPSLGRRRPDGTFAPFPGNSWNDWKPGDSGVDQFVNLITVNIFWDNTVWVCDWGAPMSDSPATPAPGAQKVVQLDPVSGKVLEVLRFDEEILPPGALLNDIQINGNYMYIADSGLGGIIVHDLSAGKTLRRLSGYPQMVATKNGKEFFSDPLHCTPDGEWLYWATSIGPFWRCRTRLVRDASIPDEELAKHVEFVSDIPSSPGAAMDSLGNLYLSVADMACIELLPAAPHNAAERPGIVQLSAPTTGALGIDNGFITADRQLYASVTLKPLTKAPWLIFSMPLPESFDGYRLGNENDGRPSNDHS